MPDDNFILMASTLVERMLQMKSSIFCASLPKEPMPEPHPMNRILRERIGRLRSLVFGLVPKNEANGELAGMSLKILDDSLILMEEILTCNVADLYESQCPRGMMPSFFVKSMMETLLSIEHHVTLAITGSTCEWCEGDCLQNLREEWSEARADHNTLKLFLLVTFVQNNESHLTRKLIVEMIEYAQTNYSSHCPTRFQEALNNLRLGKKVTFPIDIHFLQRSEMEYQQSLDDDHFHTSNSLV